MLRGEFAGNALPVLSALLPKGVWFATPPSTSSFPPLRTTKLSNVDSTLKPKTHRSAPSHVKFGIVLTSVLMNRQYTSSLINGLVFPRPLTQLANSVVHFWLRFR